MPFRTSKAPTLPVVTTLPVTIATSSSALLNGNLDIGEWQAVNVSFEYSPDEDLATKVTTPLLLRTSSGPFTRFISGLDSNTVYYYRAVAQDPLTGEILAIGEILSFTTRPPAPDGKHTVIAISDSYTSITPSGLMTVDSGSTITFEIRALPGSDYTDLIVNGQRENIPLPSYTTPPVTEDYIIEARGRATLGLMKPDFTFEYVKDGLRHTVQFYDTTTGNPNAWTWDFGDGQGPQTIQNPQHLYLGEGCSYDVTLQAKNDYNSGVFTRNINFCDSLIADGFFTITSSVEFGGSITPLGETQVAAGSGQTYRIQPNNGYRIKAVFVDGREIADVPSLGSMGVDIKDVNTNRTIHATFEWMG